MPNITYISPDGKQTKLNVKTGLTVMHGATINMVEGILAECGGALTCGTCHCYLNDHWIKIIGPAQGKEKLKLKQINNPTKNSRLSCQIKVTEALEGLTVTFPETQVW